MPENPQAQGAKRRDRGRRDAGKQRGAIKIYLLMHNRAMLYPDVVSRWRYLCAPLATRSAGPSSPAKLHRISCQQLFCKNTEASSGSVISNGCTGEISKPSTAPSYQSSHGTKPLHQLHQNVKEDAKSSPHPWHQ